VTHDNAVIKQVLDHEIAARCGDRERFEAREKDAFDFRADVITRWVAEHVAYAGDLESSRREDLWLFPDETLHLRRGDCEDRALLLASLLIASGISSYNVRVAIGRLVFYDGKEELEAYDHAWAAYKRENGVWEPLDPHDRPRRRPRPATGKPRDLLRSRLEYEPAFLFNSDHLWKVATGGVGAKFHEHVSDRARWDRIDPRFLGDLHYTLIDDALKAHGREVVDRVRRSFGHYLGHYVEDIDLPGNYDPVDHFDNCFVPEGWKRVESRLAKFAARQDLDAFGLAAHGIADFYAHSSYGHFARREGGRLAVFEPGWLAQLEPRLERPARYDQPDFDITGGRFTRGPRWGGRPGALAAQLWNGQLISGRYAHDHDSQSFFERFTWMPEATWHRKDMADRAGVPHHDEMAVDERGGNNVLYGKGTPSSRYREQFELRYATAVEHVRRAFAAGWRGPA
jgi:hypothetical protein